MQQVSVALFFALLLLTNLRFIPKQKIKMTTKLRSIFLTIIVCFCTCANAITHKKERRCHLFFNTKDVTLCDCIDIGNKNKRIDCVLEKQAQFYNLMKDNNDYKLRNKEGKTDLGFADWADRELAYIKLLNYGNESDTKVRQILYNQIVIQKGISMFRQQGFLLGGGASIYLNLAKELNPNNSILASITDENNMSDEQIKQVSFCLLLVLNNLTNQINNTQLNESQKYWSDLQNNIRYYQEAESKQLSPQSLAYEVYVLQPLANRINMLMEYQNPSSTYDYNRILNFSQFNISPTELYETVTRTKLDRN